MRKEKIMLLLIVISMLVSCILPTAVKATEGANEKWTDFSNATYEFEDISTSEFANYVLRVKNVKFNLESVYYIFFSDTTEKPDMGDGTKLRNYAQVVIEEGKEINIADAATRRTDKFLEQNGEQLYLWIVEACNSRTKEVVSAQLVQKPKQYQLGHRVNGFFNEYDTSMFIYEPNTGDRQIKLKIGKVTNKELLRSIKNKEANCLDKLMTYAKSTNAIYQTTVSNGTSGVITDKFDIIKGDYYYVYMQVDDKNETYRKIEDISLYQGYIFKIEGVDNDKSLIHYSKSGFSWDNVELIEDENQPPTGGNGEDNKTETPNPEKPTNTIQNTIGDSTNNSNKNQITTDNTQAPGVLPQTGETILYIAGIATFIALAAIGYRKYNNYKDI